MNLRPVTAYVDPRSGGALPIGPPMGSPQARPVRHQVAQPSAPRRARDPLALIRKGYCGAVIIATLLQLVLYWSFEGNLLALALCTTASLIGITYSLNAERFRKHPISASMMLFMTSTGTSGALLVKTVEMTPVAERLLVPEVTFAVLLAMQLLVILADRIYLRVALFGRARRFISERVFAPLRLYQWPSNAQIWMLGFLGCASVMLAGTDYESDATFGAAGAGMKLIRMFGFLKFAPFLIPFRGALSGVRTNKRVVLLPLLLYFLMLVGVSFATNSRSTFADAIPTVGVAFLIAVGIGQLDLRKIPPEKIIIFAVLGLIASVFLSRVALAIVVARDFRYNSDFVSLMKVTVEAMFNSEWLEIAKSKMEASTNIADYSETYVDSRFFARFLLTKFHDNIIYYCSLMGPDQFHAYKEFLTARIEGMLPDPLLRPLGINLNKEDLVVSNGDYVIYLVDGWGLGGFKTGSMIGETFGIFGWLFAPIMIACTWLVYVVYDAFAMRNRLGMMGISPYVLVIIWTLVGTTASVGFGAESVSALLTAMARGLPQNLFAYCIAVAGVRGFSWATGRGR